jgi:dihydroorotase
VIGFKLYLSETHGNLTVTNLGYISEVFKKLNLLNKIVVIHCEHNEILNYYKKLLYPDNRPKLAEVLAIADMLTLASQLKTKIHLTHITTSASLELIKSAKQRGISVTIDTCPHYLFFDKSDYKKNRLLKMNPPLRDRKDRLALWQALNSGLIDMISTDHAPHTLEEKNNGLAGVPSLDSFLQLLLDAVNKNRLSLQRLVAMTAENPAIRFGLNKGFIAKNRDADLVVVNMNKTARVNKLYTKCGWSPYQDFKLKGWPEQVIIKGVVKC